MTAAEYEARILPVIRRTASRLSVEDWGLFDWAFNDRVRLFAQLTLLDLSDEDVSILAKAQAHMQSYRQVLDVVEQKIGGRDEALAYLIVALYNEVRSQSTELQP